MNDSDVPSPGNLEDLRREREELRSAASTALGEERWRSLKPLVDLPLLVLFVIALALLFNPPHLGTLPVPALDSVADQTVRAERDVLVRDEAATALRRQAAGEAALPIFDYNPDLYFELGESVFAAFARMSERRKDGDQDVDVRRRAFEDDLGVVVRPGIFVIIEALDDPLDAAAAINFFLNLALERRVVEDRGALPESGAIELRQPDEGRTLRLSYLGNVLDLRQLRRLMSARAGDAPYDSARRIRSWILDTARTMARPNLVADKTETEKRRDAAMQSVEEVFVRLRAGEVVVRRGDRVGAAARDKIAALNQQAAKSEPLSSLAGTAMLIVGLMALGFTFFRRGRVRSTLGRKASYLTLTITAVAGALCIGLYYAGLGAAFALDLPPNDAAYFAPVALATVLTAVLVDARTSLLTGLGLALLASLRFDGDVNMLAVFIIGVLVAGIAARRATRRADLLRVGALIALVQAVAVAVIALIDPPETSFLVAPRMAGAAISGLMVAIAALGMLPLLESAFDETTDMRLLELASADSPTLKELALHAPGTHHHSTMAANLAEEAASAIGANALQCRVMALYHDVGKIKRPTYFAENQPGGENVHDRLAPDLSARIVFAHVRDGIEIARKRRLGRAIIEGICEHQGTTLLRHFHERALRSPIGNAVEEGDFRYPGPRPRSRETGVLLLADSVEAATRALKDPSPDELKHRVREIIDHKIADGQLDETELTFRDIDAMEAAFVRVLTLGVYHSRIAYPPISRRPGDGDNGTEHAARGDGRIQRLG